MNKLMNKVCLVLTCVMVCGIVADAAKTVKIKLTGTANENILMHVGNSGRTEIISSFPYILEVPKGTLPLNLKFESENYLYYTISVPKKPFDTTGHVYLVKIDENAMALNRNVNGNRSTEDKDENQTQQGSSKYEKRLDTTHGVNAAPVTGNKNENTFAVIIANEDYELAAKVSHATNDGLAFKEYCIKTLGLPEKNVKFYSNISYGRMRKALKDIVGVTDIFGKDARLLVYYAGHGIPDNKTKDAYLMPIDADGTDTDVCLSLNELYTNLNETNLSNCLIFLDACFSGAQRDGEMIVAARGVKLKPKETQPRGNTIVFSATSNDEAAFSYHDEAHGLFTYFLLKKLQESKGKVSLGELADYIKKNVSLQSRLINNLPQTPIVITAPGISSNWRSIKLNK